MQLDSMKRNSQPDTVPETLILVGGFPPIPVTGSIVAGIIGLP